MSEAAQYKAETKITESCGCVFCDLGLEPDRAVDGRPIHTHTSDGIECYMFCANPALDAALSPAGEK